MNAWMLAVAALALVIERVAYAVIWHRPDLFARSCRSVAPSRDPVDVLARLFVVFKIIQLVVFAAWCVVHGGSASPLDQTAAALIGGSSLIVVGQVLNLSVFAVLGAEGVFYGNRLGHDVPWRHGFPFSWVRHPQYVGTVLTIWGLFVIVRYPAADWMALPLLETLYYTLGALVEQSQPPAQIMPSLSAPATAADRRAAETLR